MWIVYWVYKRWDNRNWYGAIYNNQSNSDNTLVESCIYPSECILMVPGPYDWMMETYG